MCFFFIAFRSILSNRREKKNRQFSLSIYCLVPQFETILISHNISFIQMSVLIAFHGLIVLCHFKTIQKNKTNYIFTIFLYFGIEYV